MVLLKMGETEKALLVLDDLLEILPAEDDPRLNREHRFNNLFYRSKILNLYGDLAFSLNDFEKSRSYYRESLSSYFDCLLYKKIADCYFKEGDLDNASFYLKRAYILNPGDYSWAYALGLIHYQKGEYQRAVNFLKEALEMSPNNPELFFWLEKAEEAK